MYFFGKRCATPFSHTQAQSLGSDKKEPHRLLQGQKENEHDDSQNLNQEIVKKTVRVEGYLKDLEEAREKLDRSFQEVRQRKVEQSEPYAQIRKISRILEKYIRGVLDLSQANRELLNISIVHEEENVSQRTMKGLLRMLREKARKEAATVESYKARVLKGQIASSNRYGYYIPTLYLVRASLNLPIS